MGCNNSAPSAAPPAGAKPAAPPAAATGSPARWRVVLGAEVPNFECVTTKGTFEFHDFLRSDPKRPFTLLFSHPKDFTPVCTTEIGTCQRLVPEFDQRCIKLIGVSCDPVHEHIAWSKDILAREKIADSDSLAFPIISDASKEIVTQLGMIDPEERDQAGMPLPARSLILIGPDLQVKLSILYPATTGRDFNEVLRAVDSFFLTSIYNLHTPANWKPGEPCFAGFVESELPSEDAKATFQNLTPIPVPSGMPYFWTVDCPAGSAAEVAVRAAEAARSTAAPQGKSPSGDWALKLGAEVPNFECVTTSGPTMFHRFLESDPDRPWTVLLTHPKDFTPTCTTELGTCQLLVPNFAKRGVKMIGLSCDTVDSHTEWGKDILFYIGEKKTELSFPIISDGDRSLVNMLGMTSMSQKDMTARALVLIGPDKRVKLSILYPVSTGRNFDEVLRAVDSVMLTAKHSLATPANWQQGERCVVAPVVSTEDAKAKFSNLVTEDLPSGKPYLRMVDCPTTTEGRDLEEAIMTGTCEIKPLMDEGAEADAQDRRPPLDPVVVEGSRPGGWIACCAG